MIPQLIGLLSEHKGASTVVVALTVVVLLGGTGTITLPGEKKADDALAKITALETQLSSKVDGVVFAQYQQYDQSAQWLHELDWVRREIAKVIRDIAWLEDAEGRRALSVEERALLVKHRQELDSMIEIEADLKNKLQGQLQ